MYIRPTHIMALPLATSSDAAVERASKARRTSMPGTLTGTPLKKVTDTLLPLLASPRSLPPTLDNPPQAYKMIALGACGTALCMGSTVSATMGLTLGGIVLVYGGLFVTLQRPAESLPRAHRNFIDK